MYAKKNILKKYLKCDYLPITLYLSYVSIPYVSLVKLLIMYVIKWFTIYQDSIFHKLNNRQFFWKLIGFCTIKYTKNKRNLITIIIF